MKKFSFSCLAALTVSFISTVAFGQPKGQPKDEPVCDPAVVCAKKEEPKPPSHPFVLMCGEGTTRPGQAPLGLHCECADPQRTTLVTGKLDYGGKEEKCVPNKDVVDSLYALYLQLETDKANAKDVYTKEEIDKMLAEIKGMIHNLPSRIEFDRLVERVTILEARVDKLEKRVDKLERSIVDLAIGVGGEFDLRNATPGGGAHATAILEGNFSKSWGLYGEFEGGFFNSKTTGWGFEVGGSAGFSVELDDVGAHQLLFGPAARQFGRTHADEDNAIGNGLGWGVGAQLRYLGCVSSACFSPYIGILGGEVAEFHVDNGVKTAVNGAAPTFYLGFDILGLVGIGTRDKPSEPSGTMVQTPTF